MYKTFRVKNFRCFKDLQINDLGRVNLIAGKNNTGKTALMEAMYVLDGNYDSKTIFRRSPTEARRYMRDKNSRLHDPVSINTIFSDFETNLEIELSATVATNETDNSDDSRVDKLTISSVHDLNELDSEGFLNLIDRRYGLTDDSVEVLKLDTVTSNHPLYILFVEGSIERLSSRRPPSRTSTFLPARETVSVEKTSDRFSKMQEAKETQRLVEGLRVIEPRLRDIRLRTDDGRPNLDADIEGLSRLVSMRDLGDGMNRMVDMILAMHQVERGAIFIDEIENGLHFDIHQDVWLVLNDISSRLGIQVFATTHSYEMMRAAYKAFKGDDKLEDLRFHRLRRGIESGEIESVTSNKRGIEAAMSTDWEVR